MKNNYFKYKFKYFEEPADEPILALSMAICGCRPMEVIGDTIGEGIYIFLPTVSCVKLNITKGYLRYSCDGYNWKKAILLHWQNINTEKPLYMREIDRMNELNVFKIESRYIFKSVYSIAMNWMKKIYLLLSK